MTCSFLNIETKNQINTFLKKNNNFLLSDFCLKNKLSDYSKLIKKKYMITIPNMVLNFNIDGYFAAYLKKIK